MPTLRVVLLYRELRFGSGAKFRGKKQSPGNEFTVGVESACASPFPPFSLLQREECQKLDPQSICRVDSFLASLKNRKGKLCKTRRRAR